MLLASRLEPMHDDKVKLLEKIKPVVIEMVYSSDGLAKENFSDFLSIKISIDYKRLSTLFHKRKD
jgi:hypothetical protein